jgi:uncharacterized membrane protein
MRVLFTVMGTLLGGFLFGSARFEHVMGGLVVGGCLGFLFATVLQLQQRLQKLEPRSTPVDLPEIETVAAPVVEAPVSVEPAAVTVAASTPAADAAAPAEPAVEHRLWRFVREFFSGEHAIPRVGAIVLFFGVAFLLKYAAEHSLLPIELRLAGAAVGAMALLVFGWRLRHRRQAYALVLQGAAVGVLYLTVFSALRLYALISPLAALVVLVAVCAFSGALAVLQNARALAVLGATGGFLAPILVSTGAGNHVMLFSYYALLNAGIVGIAWFRAWRELNVLGFLFTFVIGVLWGVQRYHPELFASTEPFLILFFLFYVLVAVLFALRQPPDLRGYVDGTIVFGVPVVGFALQAALVREFDYGLAWSAAAAGGFYLGLATLLWRLRPSALRMLCEAFLALGVVFATLALPLALDGRWTSAAWALEGAAIVWIGARQQRLLARLFGVLLILGAGVFFLSDLHRPAIGLPVLNSIYLGTLMMALAALFAAHRLARGGVGLLAQERALAALLFAWGLLWWVGGGLREIGEHVTDMDWRVDATIGFAVLSALLAEFAGARLEWQWLRGVALALLPVGLLLAVVTWVVKAHPLSLSGAVAWVAFFAAHLLLLWRREQSSPRRYLDFLHGAAVWLVALLGAQELGWIGAQVAAGEAWWLAGWGTAPALVAAGVSLRTRWPGVFEAHRQAYVTTGAVPVLAVAGLWLVAANLLSSGDAAPLPYLPLLNPLDLASLLVLLAMVQRVSEARVTRTRDALLAVSIIGAALAFLWLNAALLRTLHHWAGVAFAWRAMMDSVLVQASLSIFWSGIALVVMWLATRRFKAINGRTLWMVGAGLLALTVTKLFLVDLARAGTIERIVSFIVVGLLLLLIGYLAPIPPREKETSA